MTKIIIAPYIITLSCFQKKIKIEKALHWLSSNSECDRLKRNTLWKGQVFIIPASFPLIFIPLLSLTVLSFKCISPCYEIPLVYIETDNLKLKDISYFCFELSLTFNILMGFFNIRSWKTSPLLKCFQLQILLSLPLLKVFFLQSVPSPKL